MRRLLTAVVVTVLATLAVASSEAADVKLRWDPVSGADSYHLYASEDTGANWVEVGSVAGDTTRTTITGVREDALVLVRVSAKSSKGEAVRTWSGAWYDHRLRPLSTPGGGGIE